MYICIYVYIIYVYVLRITHILYCMCVYLSVFVAKQYTSPSKTIFLPLSWASGLDSLKAPGVRWGQDVSGL